MRATRHIGRPGGDYDKKFEFASPDSRGSTERTAGHRYMPVEMRGDVGRAAVAASRARDEDFSQLDFRARWWPAPGVAE
jgi:hypothetical protein